MRASKWMAGWRVVVAGLALAGVAFEASAQQPQPWPRQFTLRDADGDGHPVFGNPTIVAYPLEEGRIPQATSVVFGDLNGNGSQDIATLVSEVYPGDDLTPVDRRVLFMWNDGKGGFTIGPSHTVWTFPWFPVGGLALGRFRR